MYFRTDTSCIGSVAKPNKQGQIGTFPKTEPLQGVSPSVCRGNILLPTVAPHVSSLTPKPVRRSVCNVHAAVVLGDVTNHGKRARAVPTCTSAAGGVSKIKNGWWLLPPSHRPWFSASNIPRIVLLHTVSIRNTVTPSFPPCPLPQLFVAASLAPSLAAPHSLRDPKVFQHVFVRYIGSRW